MRQPTTLILLLLLALSAAAQGKVARFDLDGLRYSNWDAPYVTLDSCLDHTATEIVIPDSVWRNGRGYPVIEIGPNAFRGCHNLVSVTLADSVNNILYGAFLDCPNLRVIVTARTRPPRIGRHAFYHAEWAKVFEPYHTLTTAIVVPEGCEPTYRNALGWSEFKNIRSTMPAPGDSANIDAMRGKYLRRVGPDKGGFWEIII